MAQKKTSGMRWFFSFLAERRGFEPRRRLPVDSLANCSITTLAPLLKFFECLQSGHKVTEKHCQNNKKHYLPH